MTARRLWKASTRRRPTSAIFDIKMPRMDGMELLNRIRKTQQFPVIFLTSKDEEIDEVLGLRMGADDFIRKPFSQRLLLERIRAVLRRADVGGAKGEGRRRAHRARRAGARSRAATSAPGRARRCTSRSPSSCC